MSGPAGPPSGSSSDSPSGPSSGSPRGSSSDASSGHLFGPRSGTPPDSFETAPDGGGGHRRTVLFGIAAVIVALGVLAVAAVAFGFFRSVEDEAARLVPADSPVYVSVLLDPSGAQKLALRDIAARFPVDTDDAESPADIAATFLVNQLEDVGLDYATDIRPWLGRQAALFFAPPSGETPMEDDGAFLLATKDSQATRDAITTLLDGLGVSDVTERSHDGVTYRVVGPDAEPAYAIVSSHLVVGTERAVRAVIETSEGGDPLADTERFEDTVDDLPHDHLVRYFADLSAVADIAGGNAGLVSPFGGIDPQEAGPTAGTLHVRDDGIVFDAVAPVTQDGATRPLLEALATDSAIADLPGDAWLAIGLGDVGATATAYLDFFTDRAGATVQDAEAALREATGLDLRDDVLAWMESAALFVRGTDLLSLRGAFVIETSDEQASVAALAGLRSFIDTQGIPAQDVEIADLTGFQVQAPGLPVPLLAVAGERVVLGAGENAVRAAIEPEERLADSPSYQSAVAALRGDANVYVELPAVIALVEASVAGSGDLPATYTEDVKPYLDVFGAVAWSTSVDDGRSRQSIFLGVPGSE